MYNYIYIYIYIYIIIGYHGMILDRTRIETETLVSNPFVHHVANCGHHSALAPLVRYDVHNFSVSSIPTSWPVCLV